MSPTDFGLGVLASWLANQIGSPKEQKVEVSIEPEESNEKPEPHELNRKVRRFKSYDVFRDLEEMLKYVNKPIAHIVVEDSPSSFYNLAALVIEDRETGILFVFSRGRMAFQGTGGGAQQTDRAVNIFKSRNIPVAPWVVVKDKLDSFENGHILWPEVKELLVPLVSSVVSTEKWRWIQQQAQEVLYPEGQV
jgi:hypothetical protein